MEWSLLAGLDPPLKQEVVSRCRRRRFSRGEIIFHQGDPGDSLFMVAVGRVAIRVSTALGDVVTLAVLGPGDAFGEMALLRDEAVRSASGVALDATELLSLHRRDFDELRRREPRVDRLLVEALAARVERVNQYLLEALHQPADKRLARRLADLFERFGGGEAGAALSFTQEDLASMAGASRPTANRLLRDLEDAGIIEIGRGRLRLLDPQALERRAR